MLQFNVLVACTKMEEDRTLPALFISTRTFPHTFAEYRKRFVRWCARRGVTSSSLVFCVAEYMELFHWKPIPNDCLKNLIEVEVDYAAWGTLHQKLKNARLYGPPDWWDTSEVTSMRSLFSMLAGPNGHRYLWHHFPLDLWCTSNVVDMSKMFQSTKFNQPIGDWDVRKVRDMSFMFEDSSFNQSLRNWQPEQLENMECMFFRSGMSNRNQMSTLGWNVPRLRRNIYAYETAATCFPSNCPLRLQQFCPCFASTGWKEGLWLEIAMGCVRSVWACLGTYLYVPLVAAPVFLWLNCCEVHHHRFHDLTKTCRLKQHGNVLCCKFKWTACYPACILCMMVDEWCCLQRGASSCFYTACCCFSPGCIEDCIGCMVPNLSGLLFFFEEANRVRRLQHNGVVAERGC